MLVTSKLAIARIAPDTPHPAGRPEQVGPDLTAFKRVDDDALRMPREIDAEHDGLLHRASL